MNILGLPFKIMQFLQVCYKNDSSFIKDNPFPIWRCMKVHLKKEEIILLNVFYLITLAIQPIVLAPLAWIVNVLYQS